MSRGGTHLVNRIVIQKSWDPLVQSRSPKYLSCIVGGGGVDYSVSGTACEHCLCVPDLEYEPPAFKHVYKNKFILYKCR